ncbi:MAG: hypothetical protein KKF06_01500 [Candidatus Margulisbacteria bacterium]|nr:hypothetical protein [Candidatus Margulisiibacteriota bacterium]
MDINNVSNKLNGLQNRVAKAIGQSTQEQNASSLLDTEHTLNTGFALSAMILHMIKEAEKEMTGIGRTVDAIV